MDIQQEIAAIWETDFFKKKTIEDICHSAKPFFKTVLFHFKNK